GSCSDRVRITDVEHAHVVEHGAGRFRGADGLFVDVAHRHVQDAAAADAVEAQGISADVDVSQHDVDVAAAALRANADVAVHGDDIRDAEAIPVDEQSFIESVRDIDVIDAGVAGPRMDAGAERVGGHGHPADVEAAAARDVQGGEP